MEDVKRAFEESRNNLIKTIKTLAKNGIDSTSTEEALAKLEEKYFNYCQETVK